MTRALVVVAHPDESSLTQHIARSIAAGLDAADVVSETADLYSEGFDPRFGPADQELYRGGRTTPGDVAAEQQRLDRVDHLVLVFPVQWWSMPALLKGWIDRVFVDGWAFDTQVTPMEGKLARMTIHLVMPAGDDAEGFARRGYDTALSTQIVTGIIGYCGAQQGVTAIIHGSETRSRDSIEDEVAGIATSIAEYAGARLSGGRPPG
ncbi:NAD(P)H-dependent oxidoreductase [Williamsia sp.]|uniref:NAD(P)H-dependent oxidoreductase n=1 Tax=Williamsia sp. TaxID=1872085 RepID=UPI001A3565A3|nr:NAD(P)H-dependent oxidoreductase [Williamsia sp.]MBJ7287385.1 NAD(P)H-dependent oxidoreductase [Williamsia sp.]